MRPAGAGSYDELRAALDGGKEPELIPLDLHMLGMSGFNGLMMLRSAHPAIPVLVVSAAEDAATIRRALDFGASRFMLKSAPVGEFAQAVEAVLAGEVWMPATGEGDEGEASRAAQVVNLTPQQIRLLAGIAEGKLNKQIAHDMSGP